eukprot:COSAG06_NODE_40207_length_404_cov_0.734426_1_plen_53_part_01
MQNQKHTVPLRIPFGFPAPLRRREGVSPAYCGLLYVGKGNFWPFSESPDRFVG